MRVALIIALLMLSIGGHAKTILFVEPTGISGGYAEFAKVFSTTVQMRHKDAKLRRVSAQVASLPVARRELGKIGVRPDVLVTAHTLIAQAAVLQFPGLPVVLATMADPAHLNFAPDAQGNGANLTGFTSHQHFEMKHFELLRQVAPQARRVGVIADAHWKAEPISRRILGESLQLFGLETTFFQLGEEGDPKALANHPLSTAMDAWFVPDTPANRIHAAGIARVIQDLSRPSIGGHGSHARNGGLMTYQPEQTNPWPRIARIVNQVLSGVAARTIRFDRPTAFELIVNERSATALGIDFAPELFRRADEVIR